MKGRFHFFGDDIAQRDVAFVRALTEPVFFTEVLDLNHDFVARTRTPLFVSQSGRFTISARSAGM